MKHLIDAAEILETVQDMDFDAIDLPLLVGALATLQKGASPSMCDSFRVKGQRLIEKYERADVEGEPNAEIVLRIYRAPSGQWEGKLFSGDDEIGGVAGCESAEAVEQQAYDSAIYPDRIEIEPSLALER